jgi:hypothetical protein
MLGFFYYLGFPGLFNGRGGTPENQAYPVTTTRKGPAEKRRWRTIQKEEVKVVAR